MTTETKTKIEKEEKDLQGKWYKTDDEKGLLPVKPILCPMCLAYGEKSEMVMRRSRIHRVADVRIHLKDETHRPYAFDLAFKCPACDFYCIFGVPTDITYAQKIYEMRKGEEFVLPEEYWANDERVKEKLKRWGYW